MNLSRRFEICVLVTLVCVAAVQAQIKPPVGIRQNNPAVHALTNGRIVVAPGTVIEKGTLVIRNGIISAIGPDAVVIPADARVWDLSGQTLYPGLIDSYSDLGVPKKPQPQSDDEERQPRRQPPQEQPRAGAKHWNPNVLTSQNADELFAPDPKAAEKLRSIGITAALVVPQKGIFRGTSAVVPPNDKAAASP